MEKEIGVSIRMPAMLLQLLLPDSQTLVLESSEIYFGTLTLHLRLAQSEGVCPDCQQASAHEHSQYTRTIADLPCGEYRVRWRLSVRRFYCDAQTCKRRTFVEQVPALVARYARRTQRLKAVQTQMAFSLPGEPGAVLATKLRLKTSPDTLLRFVRRTAESNCVSPRVLGMDDWAFRKGHRYGTILIDLERGRPIDLLADRESNTIADWLQKHPGVEIVTRDRASAYADAIRRGAPQATQVADRFHLLQNLREAVQRLLDRHQTILRKTSRLDVPNNDSAPAAQLSRSYPRRQSKRARRREQRLQRLQRYQEIKQFYAEGLSQRAIAHKLKLDRRTVRRYILADALPQRASRAIEPNVLTPFYGFLTQRWNEGCRNVAQLWREIRGRGYTGPRVRVYRWSLKQHAQSSEASNVATKTKNDSMPVLSARRASWLVVRVPSELKDDEKPLLENLLELCAPVKTAYDLAQDFGAMVRERKSGELTDWICRAKASGVAELKNFATGLERDYDAVKAGLSLAWSNGPTEGHVNRLKLIKRQMYGRANFDLLRRRVLDGY